jgi:anti-sigma regulatory factor (Ser/Thr protein kinase)
VRIRISDDGTPFDPLTVGTVERDFDELDMGGMGISLAKQAASDIDYAYADGRNVLTMHFEA